MKNRFKSYLTTSAPGVSGTATDDGSGCAIFGTVVNESCSTGYFAGGATGLALLIYSLTDSISSEFFMP